MMSEIVTSAAVILLFGLCGGVELFMLFMFYQNVLGSSMNTGDSALNPSRKREGSPLRAECPVKRVKSEKDASQVS